MVDARSTEQATQTVLCEVCGEPMPPHEQMFKFHGYSGPCPKPPLCKALLPEGWDDGTMDHMPGVKLAREAIARAEGR